MPAPLDPCSATEMAPLDGADDDASTGTSGVEPRERVAGRYELLGMLGAGAMGTVYRARDAELDEIVALKVLKKELAAAPGMIERFRREVKLARRVTHRNVARTFDIGEHGGDRFLTMEYVAGEMLGARLSRAGRLPPAEAMALGVDVCGGLSAAHAAGVLHRDLKPENVIVARDGRAVITDFGIARAFAESELRKTAGMLLGTPAYMAPEQVEGAPDLDERTDLYALGAMLFELVTGVLPFQGDTVIAMAAARLLRPPPDPRTLVPELPQSLAEVVLRLLARRREDRFASAAEAATALSAVGATFTQRSTSTTAPSRPVDGGPSPHARTLAVLPVLDAGSGADAYVADALTEDLVDLLSVVPELRVRPRGESARFVTVDRDVREIGRALGVDVVVDGSVRRLGDDVRVVVRLVTVADGFQLWAKRFERRSGDVLGVADVAATAIVRALTTREVSTSAIAAVDPAAQDLYLRGRHLLRRAWHAASRDAVPLFRGARERAPEDPRIAGALALALARSFGMDLAPPELAREMRDAAEHALRLAPAQAEAHVARGLLHLARGEASAAAGELGVALERAPNSVDALDALGRIVVELGRVEEAIALFTRALAIEPDYVALRNSRARAFALLGDWDAADDDLASPPVDPQDLAPFLLVKARLLLWRRRFDDVAPLAELASTSDLPPFVKGAVVGMLRIARARALTADDRALLVRTLPVTADLAPRRAMFNAQTRAEMLLVCGDEDAAIEMVEHADANGLFDVAWLDRCPLIEPVREHPRVARARANVALRAARALEILDR